MRAPEFSRRLARLEHTLPTDDPPRCMTTPAEAEDLRRTAAQLLVGIPENPAEWSDVNISAIREAHRLNQRAWAAGSGQAAEHVHSFIDDTGMLIGVASILYRMDLGTLADSAV